MAPFKYPDHEIKPTAITNCKPTYVLASGRDKGQGPTPTSAVTAALANARAEIALAVADARALPCPARRGCDNPCEHRGVIRVGKGIDRNIPVKVGTVWEAKAWGFESFEIRCHCPR
jgi:hypothetical protein